MFISLKPGAKLRATHSEKAGKLLGYHTMRGNVYA